MYSFYPIPDISSDHTGFCLIVIALALIGWIVCSGEEFTKEVKITVVVILLLFGLLAYNGSFNDLPPENKQVVGTFVKFEAEGFTQKSGKSYTTEHHITYVVYSINNSQVMLKACSGCNYPQRAILYKN